MIPAIPANDDRLTVLEGQEGWLFLDTAGDIDIVRLYTDEQAFGPDLLRHWTGLLERRRSYFAQRGIAYRTWIVPDAHLVYPDRLPKGVRVADRSPMRQLLDHLDPDVRRQVVYPLDVLTTGRAEHETYHCVDSVWSDWGAFLAYRQLVESLREEFPSVRALAVDDLDWSWRTESGALGTAVSPARSEIIQTAQVRAPASRAVARVVTDDRRSFLVTEQDAPHLPTAVVFRDAFMTAPMKFLSESFRRVVYVSAPAVFYDLIDRELPDVVICETAESALASAEKEPRLVDFRATFGDLMLDDDEAVGHQRRSRSLLKTQRSLEALAANDEVLARVAPTARLMMYRGGVFVGMRQFEAAVEALRHATTLDPQDAGAWFYLGQAMLMTQRHPDALDALERALHLEPHVPEMWPHAVIAATRIDSARAEDLAQRGFELHPTDAAIAHALSYALLTRNRLAEAADAARIAMAADPDTVAYARHLAAVLIRLEDWDEAAAILAELQRTLPDDLDIARFTALVSERRNARTTDAIRGVS